MVGLAFTQSHKKTLLKVDLYQSPLRPASVRVSGRHSFSSSLPAQRALSFSASKNVASTSPRTRLQGVSRAFSWRSGHWSQSTVENNVEPLPGCCGALVTPWRRFKMVEEEHLTLQKLAFSWKVHLMVVLLRRQLSVFSFADSKEKSNCMFANCSIFTLRAVQDGTTRWRSALLLTIFNIVTVTGGRLHLTGSQVAG